MDIEVCQRAAQNILRFPDEFFSQKYADSTLSALNRGLDRVRQAESGEPLWPALKGRGVRAYRSPVDGVAHPYRLIIPESYDPAKPARLYVYLHGRDASDPGSIL